MSQIECYCDKCDVSDHLKYHREKNHSWYTINELVMKALKKKKFECVENICHDENDYKLSNYIITKSKLIDQISNKPDKKYRDILNNGIKIVFKQKKSDTKINNEKLSGIIENNLDNLGDFQKIIFEIIEQENDPYLSKVYNLIITST